MRFTDRTVLVVGGSNGIGRATVDRFLTEGATVVVADREDDPGPPSSPRCHFVRADVTSTASVEAAVAAAGAPLDALVCVAGGAHAHPMVDGVEDDDWQAELDLNLTGPMRCVRAALPHLTEGGASITLVASVNGLAALGNEPYSAAKAGLVSLARNLAVSLGPRGVRVNVVAPGTVRTRVWDTQPGGADRLAPLYPLGRVGEPADIAAAIAFLASDDAAWITGVTLPVDGGLLAGPAQVLPLLFDR